MKIISQSDKCFKTCPIYLIKDLTFKFCQKTLDLANSLGNNYIRG